MTTAEVEDFDHRIERVDLDELLGYRLKDNPKRHDEATIELSIDKFGFINPVLVGTVGKDKGAGLLGAGHGRLKDLVRRRAAKKKPPLGIRLVDGKWMVPTIRGVHFESRAAYRAYVVMDNRAGERGGYEDHLVDYLKALGKEVTFSGYSQDDVRLLAQARNPWVSDIGAVDARGDHLEGIPGKVVVTCKPRQTTKIRDLVTRALARGGFKDATVA